MRPRCATMLLVLALAIVATGCETSSDKIDDLERLLPIQMELQFSRQGLDVEIDSVALVHEGGNRYTGIAEGYMEGVATRWHVEVTADGDNVLWRAAPI